MVDDVLAATTSAVTVSLAELSDAWPDARIVGDRSTPIAGISYDSRLVRPGDLFAALRGADDDGHAFAAAAVRNGAAAILAEREVGLSVPTLLVADSRAALAPIAARFFRHPSHELRVIGITGTDGKTTTSYLIDGMLRRAGLVTGMVGTVAVRVADHALEHESRQTTPESADLQRYLRRMVEEGVGWGVVEATSHGLDMHRLDAVRFEIGAVTNITHEHLEHHRTIPAYRRAKAILFERVAANRGIAVVNADDPGAMDIAPYAAGASRLIRYSCEGRAADVGAVQIESDARGSRFGLVIEGMRTPIAIPLIGGFNVANALCAAAVGLAAGLLTEAIADGLEHAPTVPGRMVRVDAGQPFDVVVDYAHTPESLAKVLILLRRLHPTGRLIAVFGSAGERDVEKRALQGRVAAQLADFSVFTTEDPRFEDPDAIIAQIAAGAAATGRKAGNDFACVTDRREAIRHALGTARPGDCVLLAGKGHEGSIIWGREKRPWNETEAARAVLADLGHGTPQ